MSLAIVLVPPALAPGASTLFLTIHIFYKRRPDLMSVTMHLGSDNKHKATHKSGQMTWSYVQGKLSRTVDGEVHTLSSQDTLALANLLHSHYSEIVQFARAEQRVVEEASDRRKWKNDLKMNMRLRGVL
jgi:hypothetical protein